MGFHWLQMRISEETDRRDRDALARDRLPRALAELHGDLAGCVEAYRQAFGPESATIDLEDSRIVVTVRERRGEQWAPVGSVTISIAPELPGFRIEREGERLLMQVGILPGDKVFYKSEDKFLTLEEVTRRILDRALFPKLGE